MRLLRLTYQSQENLELVLFFPLHGSVGDSSHRQLAAHSDSPFENDRLMAGARAISKGADGLGALVCVCHEEIVQPFVAERFEKPLAMRESFIQPICSYCK